MASTRASVKKNATLASFFSSGKPKEPNKPGFSPRKPPDKDSKPPNTASAKKKTRSASQPTTSSTSKDKATEPAHSASQPAPAPLEEEDEELDTEIIRQTPQPDHPEEESTILDDDLPDLDFTEDWNWLVSNDITTECDTVNVDDMVAALISLSTNIIFSKDKLKAAIRATTNILIAALNEEREEWERQGNVAQVEEGEIPPTNFAAPDSNQTLGELKTLMHDSLLRATAALEEATKELREVRKEVHPPPIATPPAIQPTSSPTVPYSEAAAVNLTPQQIWPANSTVARAKAKARQLVFDLREDHKLLKLSNISIRDEFRLALKKANAPPHVDIFSVRKLSKGGLLLELNSEGTGDWLRIPANSASFRSHADIEVDFTPRTFNLLAKFMPTGMFDPDNEEHMSELREENCWEKSTLRKARWAKAIENRKPGQAHAHLLLTFADSNEINALLLERGFISYHGLRISIEKDRRIPMRCARCQLYGHIAKDCSRDIICGKCSKPNHDSKTCSSNETRCINCKQDGHEAYSTACPTFQRKLKEYNARTPENALAYYPQPEPYPTPQPTQNNATPQTSL